MSVSRATAAPVVVRSGQAASANAEEPPQARRLRVHPAHLLVLAAVVWTAIVFIPEVRSVPYLNDSAMHEQMVRFATQQFRAGHLPLRSWYPFLGLGSPQFLHYQSLGAMITGAAGLLVGPNVAFGWSLYLLLVAWPVSVYVGARLLELDRWEAGLAAAASPFLASAIAVGYEDRAYLWVGYGVWAQLWASLTLPLAWGFTWQAVAHGRHRAAAVLTVALTVAFHYETGYLALAPLLFWPLAAGLSRAHLRRGLVVVIGVALAAAWVVVPVLHYSHWASINEALQGGPLENGYGARTVLHWMITGQMLDEGRIPVVTVLAGVGLVLTIIRLPRSGRDRALLLILAFSLFLCFGRTTFGSLMKIVPGDSDLFLRRFMMGAQLVAVFLAGIGGVWVVRVWWGVTTDAASRAGRARLPAGLRGGVLAAGLALLATAVVLAPAWVELDRVSRGNAEDIDYQRAAQPGGGAEVDHLLAYVDRHGGGRVYAGQPTNWGTTFRVGLVPVYKYLAARDVDEVGFTLRTASLMTDPEYNFDPVSPGENALFGVRYLILPATMAPPVAAQRTLVDGPYALWVIPGDGYVRVGTIVGTLSADRDDVGDRTAPYQRSALPADAAYLQMAWDSNRVRNPPPTVHVPALPGGVERESDDLDDGHVSAVVAMRRPGIAVLSASYDPGWTVTVNGRPERTIMVSPALPAVRLGAGVSRIAFRYVGARSYDYLIPVAVLTIVALFAVEALTRRRRLRVS